MFIQRNSLTQELQNVYELVFDCVYSAEKKRVSQSLLDLFLFMVFCTVILHHSKDNLWLHFWLPIHMQRKIQCISNTNAFLPKANYLDLSIS